MMNLSPQNMAKWSSNDNDIRSLLISAHKELCMFQKEINRIEELTFQFAKIHNLIKGIAILESGVLLLLKTK